MKRDMISRQLAKPSVRVRFIRWWVKNYSIPWLQWEVDNQWTHDFCSTTHGDQIKTPRHIIPTSTGLDTWKRRGLIPGPLACEASALPLSYAPCQRHLLYTHFHYISLQSLHLVGSSSPIHHIAWHSPSNNLSSYRQSTPLHLKLPILRFNLQCLCNYLLQGLPKYYVVYTSHYSIHSIVVQWFLVMIYKMC